MGSLLEQVSQLSNNSGNQNKKESVCKNKWGNKTEESGPYI